MGDFHAPYGARVVSVLLVLLVIGSLVGSLCIVAVATLDAAVSWFRGSDSDINKCIKKVKCARKDFSGNSDG